ncbi:MAG: GDSL-type esterase/lipase family protein [Kiritimatiellaeota bacterium]|nr:GDSL-type esterase/lipase family protein [Kiritimatiellota bacterium]
MTIEGDKVVAKEGGIATIEAVVTQWGRRLTATIDVVVAPYYRDYHQALVMKLFLGMDGDPVERLASDRVLSKKGHEVLYTFEQALDVIRKTDNLTRGIPKILYLVGWQKGGHDHGYPAWSEVNPRLKRKQDATPLDSLRWLIREARKFNTTVSLHINMLDAYKQSPLWDEYVAKDCFAKDASGQLLVAGIQIKGEDMYNVVYPKEWEAGLAQRRIDGLIKMIPELKEGHTIHIDVFIAQRDSAPISPWHAKPENGGISVDKYVATQRKIFHYWRDRGFDVTGEGTGWSHPPGEHFVGLQAMSWLYGWNPMEIPECLGARGRTTRDGGGDPRIGTSMHGEDIWQTNWSRDSKENMAGFLGEFCRTTLSWYYLSRLERIKFENDALIYSDGVVARHENGKRIIRKGDFVAREDDNLFVPALWNEKKEIMAYSGLQRQGLATAGRLARRQERRSLPHHRGGLHTLESGRSGGRWQAGPVARRRRGGFHRAGGSEAHGEDSERSTRRMTIVKIMASVAGVLVLTLNVFAGATLDPAKPDEGNAEWRMRHGERVADVKSHAQELEVLFIGDSITIGWRDIGRAIWEKEFVPLYAVNIGIAGSQTSHILWQFEHGAIDGINPRVTMLMIGVNNVVASPSQSAADIARGISAIVAKLRDKLPRTKVLLLGTFPKDRVPGTPDRRKIQEINTLIAKLDDGKRIRFLDIGSRLLDKDSNLTAEVSSDGVHLTEKGYQIWADAVRSPLHDMLAKTSPQPGHSVPGASTLLADLKPIATRGSWKAGGNLGGNPFKIGGLEYPSGVGAANNAEITYALDGRYQWFQAWVGLDTQGRAGKVRFQVFTDGQLAYDTGTVRHGPEGNNPHRAIGCRVPLAGVREMKLLVTGDDGILADWAGAQLWRSSIPLPDPNRFGRDKNLAATPPMGWNSWCGFSVGVNDAVVRRNADAMVRSGMKDAGYQYIIIDDHWSTRGERDKDGNLQSNPQKFPAGMKALADYVHSKGLKFGMYTDAKSLTCGGFPGSYGHYEQDAKRFAEWGVDYLKVDWNGDPDPAPPPTLYSDFGKALAVHRPTLYNICEWGYYRPWSWARKAGGHMWRTTFDLIDRWDTDVDSCFGNGIVRVVDQNECLGEFAGAGGWNDLDQLFAGLYGYSWQTGEKKKSDPKYIGCTDTEYRAQMSLWCLLCAPLIAGCDLADMNQTTRELLTNRELIALNQDPLGIPAWRAQKMGDLEVWTKPLKNGDIAVGLFNRSDKPQRMTASWRCLDISGQWKARDLWAHKDLGEFEGGYSCEPAGHEVRALRLSH